MMSTITQRKRNQRKSILKPKKSRVGYRDDYDPTVQIQTNKNSNMPQISRTGSGRVKKTKVPFDPSELRMPRRRQTINCLDGGGGGGAGGSSGEPTTKKSKSHLTNELRKNSTQSAAAVQQPFFCGICEQEKGGKCVTCKECDSKVHHSCLLLISKHFSKAEEQCWLCDACRTCAVCYETDIIDVLYKCYVCFNSYHMECYEISVSAKPTIIDHNRFRCNACDVYDETLNKQSNSKKSSATENAIDPVKYIDEMLTKSLKSTSSTKSSSTSSLNNLESNNCNTKSSSSSSTAQNSSGSGSGRSFRRTGFAGFSDSELKKNAHIKQISSQICRETMIDTQIPSTSTSTSTIIGKEIKSESSSNTIPLSPNNEHNNMIVNNPVISDDADTVGGNIIAKQEINKSDEYNYWAVQGEDGVGGDDSADGGKSGNDVSTPLNVPDPKNWTPDDVFNYFVKYFPSEANVFREQEIDGCCLLLLKRQDVIKKMNLKLGSALNIYSHIIRLQTKNNDIRLAWM